MDKARKKFKNRARKEIFTTKKKGLSVIDEDTEKNIENEILEDDRENAATVPSGMFESVSYDDGFDQFKEY